MLNSNREKILLDIGSSTVKVYFVSSKGLKWLLNKSIPFKQGFDPTKGLAKYSKNELYKLIDSIKKDYDLRIKTFATAVFRKLGKKTRTSFVDEFFQRTGVYLNIIDQELENFYLERALIGNYVSSDPILVINIGGGSTELVVLKNQRPIEKKNIDLGVGTVNTNFSGINNQISEITLANLVGYVKDRLPVLRNRPKIAFYTGGELTFMKLSKYPVKRNHLFDDKDHPYEINLEGFVNKNKQIFEKITLKTLESLMTENPAWMKGARSCSAIAQAICEKYGVKTIIPSDSNLIHGVVRQEFRKVTISGSFRKHLDYILGVKEKIESTGAVVLSPRFTKPKNPGEEFVVFSGEEEKTPLELERYHLNSIDKSDVLVVCDPEGYVGASALFEIGYAHVSSKRIIFTEEPEEFLLGKIPSEIGL